MSPTKRRWRIEDPFASQKGVANGTASGDASIEIAGLDWGGDGPIALLNHANGFCAATWGLVAGKLCERFRVVGIDARGHGDSDTRPASRCNVEIRRYLHH